MFKKISETVNPAALDMYGSKPNINIQGESTSYSGVGIIATSMVLGFVVWATYFNSLDLFYKLNPTVTTSNLPASTIDIPIELTPDIFDMYFGVVNIQNNIFYINASVYTVEAVYSPNPLNQSKDIKLNIEPCKPSFLTSLTNAADGIVWCFSKNQSTKINLYTKTTAYVTVNFKRCNPASSKVPCLPDAMLDQVIGISFAGRIYSDWKIDPFNYKEPLQRYYKVDLNGLATQQTKAIYIYLVGTQFTTDDGWLLPTNKTQNIYTVERIESDFADRTYDLILQRMVLATSGNKNTYVRQYVRVQDVLAQIGSLCSGFIFVIGLLVLPYSDTKMYESMVNRLYHVQYHNSRKPMHSTTIDFGGRSPNKKRFNSSDRRVDEDISVIDDRSQHTQREFINDTQSNDIKMSDQTNPNISKLDFIQDDTSQVKEIELPNRIKEANKLKIILNNQSALQDPNMDAVELQDTGRDFSPDPLQSAHTRVGIKNETENSIIQKDNAEKVVERESGCCCWKRRRNRVVPGSVQKKRNNIKVGYIEFLLSIFRKKPKLRAIEKAKRQIKIKFDFHMIFKKLHEIERLKECLMTRDQQILFNSIRKPILNIYLDKADRHEKDPDEDKANMEDDDDQMRFSEIKEAYLNLKRGGRTTLDRNLVLSFERNKDSIELMSKR